LFFFSSLKRPINCPRIAGTLVVVELTDFRGSNMSEPVQGDVASWRNSFGFSISLHTVAVFCEHTEEMLADATDRDELLKRHRNSLERRATGMPAKY
jgi:hypothetical protein